MAIKIKDIPYPRIRRLARKYLEFADGYLNFDWASTPEGWFFWNAIDKAHYSAARKQYPGLFEPLKRSAKQVQAWKSGQITGAFGMVGSNLWRIKLCCTQLVHYSDLPEQRKQSLLQELFTKFDKAHKELVKLRSSVLDIEQTLRDSSK